MSARSSALRASAGTLLIARTTVPPSAVRPMERMQGRRGGHMTALVVGLISIVVVWVVVIYGSIYVNKNVQ
jgi:hypothetical protein